MSTRSKTKNVLFIDTSKRHEVLVSLDGKRLTATQTYPHRAQVVLQLIDKLLQSNKVEPSQLAAIEVVTDGESFTGVRVGVTVANALAYSLHIPVNKHEVGTYAEPTYAEYKGGIA